MTKIKRLAAGLMIAAALSATPVRAQTVRGEVRKIDEAAGKITLKHGPIKALDMDEGMTMVFHMQNPAVLKQLKVGDKVEFDADRVDGQITVTRIQKAK